VRARFYAPDAHTSGEVVALPGDEAAHLTRVLRLKRGEVTIGSVIRGRRRERWQRIAVSSAKQCGRAIVPPILEAEPFDAVASLIDERQLPTPALLLAEPLSGADVVSLSELERTPPREASLLIGPEGGWTPEEIASSSERCRVVTLGGRTIRSDAMALVAVAALFAKWKEY